MIALARSTAALLCLCALAACGRPPSPDPADAPHGPAIATPLGSAIPSLEGELACSFTQDGARAASLIAKAWVDATSRPDAVVGLVGHMVRLTGAGAGGFGRLEREGGAFVADGLAVTLAVTDPRDSDAGEGSARRATLTLTPDGAQSRSVIGRWTCGP